MKVTGIRFWALLAGCLLAAPSALAKRPADCHLYWGALAPLPSTHPLVKFSRIFTGHSPFGGDLQPERASWLEMTGQFLKQGVAPANLLLGIHERHGKLAYSYLPNGDPVLYIADPSMIDQVLLHTSRQIPNGPQEKANNAIDLEQKIDRAALQFGGARKWFGKDAIFTGTGHGWKAQREAMQAHFKPSAFLSEENYPIMTGTVARRMAELREKVGSGKVVDLQVEAENAILDIVLRTLFHTKVDPLEIDRDLRPGLNGLMRWMVFDTVLNPTGIDLMQTKANLGPEHVRAKKAHAKLFEVADRILDEHERNPRNDLVGTLLSNRQATREQIRKQIALIIAVSLETSSSYASWALDSIARDHSIQTGLRQELDQQLQGQPIKAKDKTPYLDGVLAETLRYYAPFYFIMRQVKEPITLVRDDGKKLVVPGGTRLALSVQASQRQEDVWGVERTGFPADRFEPARWWQPQRPEKEADENDLCAFGAGSHTCLGMQFSKAEVRLLVSQIVQNFELEATKPKAPDMGSRVATFPIGGVPVKLRPR